MAEGSSTRGRSSRTRDHARRPRGRLAGFWWAFGPGSSGGRVPLERNEQRAHALLRLARELLAIVAAQQALAEDDLDLDAVGAQHPAHVVLERPLGPGDHLTRRRVVRPGAEADRRAGDRCARERGVLEQCGTEALDARAAGRAALRIEAHAL